MSAVTPHLSETATLVISLANPLIGLPLVAPVVDRLLGRMPAEPGPPGRSALRLWSGRSLRLRLEAAGLSSVRVFAALPEANRPKYLVPLESSAATAHFFGDMLPRAATPTRRLLGMTARLAARVGLLERMVPSFEIACSNAPGP